MNKHWKFILIRDKDTINKLAEAALQQLWIASAPFIIVVSSETEKLNQFYGVRGERLYSIQNCAAAIQNMLLAAHALGLASCWVGAFDENIIKTHPLSPSAWWRWPVDSTRRSWRYPSPPPPFHGGRWHRPG